MIDPDHDYIHLTHIACTHVVGNRTLAEVKEARKTAVERQKVEEKLREQEHKKMIAKYRRELQALRHKVCSAIVGIRRLRVNGLHKMCWLVVRSGDDTDMFAPLFYCISFADPRIGGRSGRSKVCLDHSFIAH